MTDTSLILKLVLSMFELCCGYDVSAFSFH